MLLRTIVASCLCFCLTVPTALATIVDIHLKYTDVASSCGRYELKEFSSGLATLSYSHSDYVVALSEATTALRDARKVADKEGQVKIKKIISQLKECSDQEETHLYIPQDMDMDCDQVISFYEEFSARSANLIANKQITDNDRDTARERFRKPVRECIRDLATNCLDPNDTREIDLVINVFRIATDLGLVYSSEGKSAVDQFLDGANPFNLSLKFCSGTDFSCKGDADVCIDRGIAIKKVMQEYIDRWQ